MPERDEHYWKYRVFREPGDDQVPDILAIGHPVPMKVSYLAEETGEIEAWIEADEIDGAFFVLRPESDHHARVALAAYAYSCMEDLPHLAKDLLHMLEDAKYQEDTGDSPLVGEFMSDDIVRRLRVVK